MENCSLVIKCKDLEAYIRQIKPIELFNEKYFVFTNSFQESVKIQFCPGISEEQISPLNRLFFFADNTFSEIKIMRNNSVTHYNEDEILNTLLDPLFSEFDKRIFNISFSILKICKEIYSIHGDNYIRHLLSNRIILLENGKINKIEVID